jgi:repressor LexA
MANFSERLKTLRTAAHLSQEELSVKLKVSRSCIGNYEQGKRLPDIEDLEQIADFFNVDMDYLVGKTDIQKELTVDYFTENEYLIIEAYRNDENLKSIIDRMMIYYKKIKEKTHAES